ncbi:hypothetical protein JYB87_03995 [Shewanella avicenniae]|uniref:NAD(+)--dinitrogen-reductase ADP-D-ribosyltransferase n=1 Tax=Shewanella avicenniae TaxID=2814294 RepID=A0ABX7QSJ0_9GAMM|nr:NAD(+)--dinitrogen-reductase ADP-D-ribosyltransferase [Shewanella avicenniae]QSX34422.1 hypothetical protein JYB87_03995 [Shewanella avicenniae]
MDTAAAYQCSEAEMALLQQVTLPLNHCSVPSWLLASLAYQQRPIPLQLDSVGAWYQKLFCTLSQFENSADRAASFNDFMQVRFCLAVQSGSDITQEIITRPKVNYRRLLLGWLMDSDNDQGAAWRSWVESRFGLLTQFHQQEAITLESDAYLRFRHQCSRATYNTNEVFEQLDLLYQYCQLELSLRYPQQEHLCLYRGSDALPAYQFAGQTAMLFNNLSSFTLSAEGALHFGTQVVKVSVPLTKIVSFDSLLPGSLQGEQEFMVLGGLYAVELITI